MIRLVRDRAERVPETVGVQLGGSYARGTWLAGKADIDVFVRFAEDTPEKRFRRLGEKIGFDSLSGFGPYTRYSEHPYVEALVRGTRINVVPCYDVKKGGWKSAADRSQFHTEFMRSELDEKMRGEVRALKQFLRAGGIYGAEISKQGFSGYVSEVLVWNLGSFRGVLERFAKIKRSDVIGTASKEFDTTITIADPVDPNRNLAAALSEENISKFILAARAFLKSPSAKFFRPKTRKIPRRVLENVVTVEFTYGPRSPDVISGQIKKAAASLSTQLAAGGFTVVRNLALSAGRDRALLVFLLESLEISTKRVKEGPEIFQEGDVASFVAKNLQRSQLMWVNKENRVSSLESREFHSATRFLRDLLTAKPNRSGIPGGLREDIGGGFKISAGGRGLRKSIKEDLSGFVTTDEKIFSAR